MKGVPAKRKRFINIEIIQRSNDQFMFQKCWICSEFDSNFHSLRPEFFSFMSVGTLLAQ